MHGRSGGLGQAADQSRQRDLRTDACHIRGSAQARRSARELRGSARRSGRRAARHEYRDRKSVVEGKSVAVRVDLGGRRIIKTKKIKKRPTITQSTKLTHTHYIRNSLY